MTSFSARSKSKYDVIPELKAVGQNDEYKILVFMRKEWGILRSLWKVRSWTG